MAKRRHGRKALAARKVDVVEQKLAEFAALRESLKTLVDPCPGQGQPEDCPILRTFADCKEVFR